MSVPFNAMKEALSLLPPKMSGSRAMTMLLAIGLQESGFAVRRQYGDGPARGYWQFEREGGVKGVMQHVASSSYAAAICAARGVEFDKAKVWAALETDDVLAAVFARLLLWTDPKPLPSVPSQKAAWEMYLRNWRPGKPHPDKWPECHRAALELLP